MLIYALYMLNLLLGLLCCFFVGNYTTFISVHFLPSLVMFFSMVLFLYNMYAILYNMKVESVPYMFLLIMLVSWIIIFYCPEASVFFDLMIQAPPLDV